MLRRINETILAIAIAFLIINSTTPLSTYSLTAKENTTLSYNVYAEGLQLLWGENRAMAVVAGRIGGNITVGFDITDSAFSRIQSIVMSWGKGFNWTKYIHRPIWELPPGASLILQYRVGFGYTEDDAIADAFRAANLIGSAYGISYHVIWEEFKNNIVTIQFYGIMNATSFDTFFRDTFKNILGNEGLMSLITVEAMEDAPYARLMLLISRDREDINENGDRNEFVPVAGAAFIVENAVIFYEDSNEYEISLNYITQHSGPIIWSKNSLWSVIEVKLPFPVILNKEISTPTNSSYPAVTGRYTYILHAKDPITSWEYNWPSDLNDVVIRFKQYNYSESMNRFPIIQAKFTVNEYPYGSTITQLTLSLEIKNNGNAVAWGVRAVIPLNKEAYDALNWLATHQNMYGENYFQPRDWELIRIIGSRGERYLLRTRIGSLQPSESVTKVMVFKFDELFNPTVIGNLLPFNIGPIVLYRDRFNVSYSVIANGFIYPLSGNGTFIIPQVYVETPSGKSFVEVGKTVTIVTNLTNYGGLPAEDISVQVIHGILDEFGNIIDMEVIDSFHVDSLADSYSSPEGYSYQREVTYQVRTKPGLHFVGAIVNYKGYALNASTGTDVFEFDSGPIISNLYSMFVLPPARVRGNIFRYPLPHAEIYVNKTLIIDNNTGKIRVHLEISNIGDLNTTIIHIIDFWNASQVTFDGNVTINGSPWTTGYGAITNDKIGITYVVIGNKENPIELPANTTIIVEYDLDIKLSGPFELLSNPTIVFYDFGPYQMERTEKPGESKNETSRGAIVYATGVRMLQESSSSQFVQTFSQAILELVSVVSPPVSGGGLTPPRIPRLLVFLVGIALVLIVVGGIMIKKKE